MAGLGRLHCREVPTGRGGSSLFPFLTVCTPIEADGPATRALVGPVSQVRACSGRNSRPAHLGDVVSLRIGQLALGCTVPFQRVANAAADKIGH